MKSKHKGFTLIEFKMYANEWNRKLPRTGDEGQADDPEDLGLRAIMDGPAVYPEYLTDLKIFFCPSTTRGRPEDYIDCPGGGWCNNVPSSPLYGMLDPDYIGDKRSYLYYGWMTEDAGVWLTMIGASQAAVYSLVPPSLAAVDQDINLGNWGGAAVFQAFVDDKLTSLFLPAGLVDAKGNGGGDTIYRLREGIERFLITDINNPASSAVAQSEIPVMWDHIEGNREGRSSRSERFNHIPGGANVVYLDGHVEFLKYPGEHPASLANATGAGY